MKLHRIKIYRLISLCIFLMTGLFNTGMAQKAGGGVVDIDGNHYQTVIIGNQEWMASNLKTTRLNDGEAIQNVTADSAWSRLSTPAYCWYNNDISNKDTHGALYNWYVIETGKLCPKGWHIPSDEEWESLINYLGGAEVAGGKLKETGTGFWVNPNTGASNESGFSGLASGNRYGYKISPFLQIGYYSDWWSSTLFRARTAWSRRLHFNSTIVSRNTRELRDGCSVRCVKDY